MSKAVNRKNNCTVHFMVNEEDMKVPLAVSRALPQIEELVEKKTDKIIRKTYKQPDSTQEKTLKNLKEIRKKTLEKFNREKKERE